MKLQSNKLYPQPLKPDDNPGFTVVEVIVAASIMIILCIGLLTVFSYVVKINRGENLRMQALSILQAEVEYYRSLKFVPVGSSTEINGKFRTNMGTRTSAVNPQNQITFVVWVTIDNDPFANDVQVNANVPDATCKFKEITIEAVPPNTETGWLSNLQTTVTIQRVRAN